MIDYNKRFQKLKKYTIQVIVIFKYIILIIQYSTSISILINNLFSNRLVLL